MDNDTPDQGSGEAPVRVVLAKLGLDGHDRGLKVVARMLRDAGMEVVYLGLRQTTETIIDAVEQEDADVVGISMLNAGHLTLGPRMVEALSQAGLDVPVIIGGIVPDDDRPAMAAAGVAGVLGPGASAEEVVACVQAACRRC
ncbi:MAG TPA: methylmalonyl-CoA mutase [Acidimicrobiaceae bacterium]|nr:methylmalonyl-CoA mutase [Acidimicrobiaceae bacterium]HAQ22809.1 methylmalonyl-CoA mutase [Acidimicrobiaceae bacterium]HCV34319.1 methylmalonyl-CoA mutase [Acidimicrobiaceae bacterium]